MDKAIYTREEVELLVNESKSYYSVTPADVRYDKNLCANAKLLYGELTALAHTTGYCWASNNYFATLYQVTPQAISKWINLLAKFGYIKIDYVFKPNSKEIDKRKIYIGINQTLRGYQQIIEGVSTNIDGGYQQKIKDNNKSFNNTINIKDYTTFLEFWNSKDIIKHKNLSKKSITLLNSLLRDNKESEIMQAISNYSEIVKNPDFWFNYKWTLEEFLQRGFAKFNIDNAILKENYIKKKDINNPNKPSVDYCGTDTRKVYYE